MKLKLLFILFSAIAALFFFVIPVAAQTKTVQTEQIQQSIAQESPDLHTHTQTLVIEIIAALSCQLTGIDPINPDAKCLGIDLQNRKIGYVEKGGGAIGTMEGLIAMTFKIPVSSTQYIAYLGSNFGITKPTYAQAPPAGTTKNFPNGLGFTGLNPLLKLWTTFRNTVYLLFVLLFIIVGLGIMLRIKIDPRTVMTLQNQIPKIVIALILVTFSFAIAGVLIDVMYVVLYLAFGLFAAHAPVASFNPTELQGSSPFNAAGGFGDLMKLIKDASSSSVDILQNTLFQGGVFRTIGSFFSLGNLLSTAGGFLAGGPIGAIAGAVTGRSVPIPDVIGGQNVLGWLAEGVAFIIFAIAVLTALFRLWFALIRAYITILIDVVLAPFWIALGLLPGSSINFTAWLRDIVAHLAAFPTTLIMFLFAKFFINMFSQGTDPRTFVPPFIGNPGDAKVFGALIGIGIILMTPEAVNMMRAAFKSPQNRFTAAIGQHVGTGAGVITRGGRAAAAGAAPNPLTGQRNVFWGVARTIFGF